jgi:hypothetical protein
MSQDFIYSLKQQFFSHSTFIFLPLLFACLCGIGIVWLFFQFSLTSDIYFCNTKCSCHITTVHFIQKASEPLIWSLCCICNASLSIFLRLYNLSFHHSYHDFYNNISFTFFLSHK